MTGRCDPRWRGAFSFREIMDRHLSDEIRPHYQFIAQHHFKAANI
jgi:hypothetical protein